MRRTDEAFKNELFRRYGQYKKNRRNLRMLAAAPVVVSAMIVCGLIFLPKLVSLNTPPVAEQPGNTTLGNINDPNTPDTSPNITALDSIKLAPSNPFYTAWEQLKQISPYRIALSTLPVSDESLARNLTDKTDINQTILQLGKLMQTANGDSGAVSSTDLPPFSSYTYVIDLFGSPSAAVDELPTAQIKHSFQLVSNQYLRYGENDWYEIDKTLAKALIDLLTNGYIEPESHLLAALDLFERYSTVKVDARLSNNNSTVTRTFDGSSECEPVASAIRALLGGTSAVVDQNHVRDQFTESLLILAAHLEMALPTDLIVGNEPEYVSSDCYINLKNGRYLCYWIDNGAVSDWYEIDEALAKALTDLLINGTIAPEPESPLAPALDMLEQISIDHFTISISKNGVERGFDSNDSAVFSPVLTALENVLKGKSVLADQTLVERLDAAKYLLELSGDPLPSVPGGDVPTVILDYSYELIGGKYLRYGEYGEYSDWIEVDADAVAELTELMDRVILLSSDAPVSGNPFYGITSLEAFVRPDGEAPNSIMTSCMFKETHGTNSYAPVTPQAAVEFNALIDLLCDIELTSCAGNHGDSEYDLSSGEHFGVSLMYENRGMVYFDVKSDHVFTEQNGCFQTSTDDADKLYAIFTRNEELKAADDPIGSRLNDAEKPAYSITVAAPTGRPVYAAVAPQRNSQLFSETLDLLSSLSIVDVPPKESRLIGPSTDGHLIKIYRENSDYTSDQPGHMELFVFGQYLRFAPELYSTPVAWYKLSEAEATMLNNLINRILVDAPV